MPKKNKYDYLADHVVDLVGGKDNIIMVAYCMTRLRFNVKDKSLVKDNEIEEIEGVVGTNWSGEQLQIIIGQQVPDVYKLVCERNGLAQQAAVDENLDDAGEGEKKKFSINSIFDGIAGCITPLIPVLIGCGMIKVIIVLIDTFGLMDAASTTYQIMTFAGDAGFYFLPVLVGYTSAKKFGANEGIGMAIGGMLIYPTFVSGIGEGVSYNLFGLPIYSASYSSTIFPMILVGFVMAPVEKFFARISPDAIRSITEPLGTLIVMVPLAYCVLGPLGAIIGNYLSSFMIWLYNTTGFIGVAALGALTPLLVMTGMHSSFTPYLLNTFATLGYEGMFMPTQIVNNIDQGAACFAVAAKTKKKNLRENGVSCGITAVVGGVTEPAMFGINLKLKTPFYATMIGNACGGAFAGLMGAAAYAFAGSGGLFGLIAFIGPSGNLIYMCIGVLIGVVVTFIATYMLYSDEA